MLGLKTLTISGFGPYGEDGITLNLDNLGPTLIVGQNGDDVSNGSGKSSLVNAILWCLFGKVPASERPADNVIGWGLDECRVVLETNDNYKIERKRKKTIGELLIYKDDVDITHSTNTNAQVMLNRLFDLDYELFTAGTFFGQFSKPFLELPDMKRRKALERLLHLHRMNARAEIAYEKVKEINQLQSFNRIDHDKAVADIDRIKSNIINTKEKLESFEEKRSNEIEKMTKDLNELEQNLSKETLINIQDLRAKWEVVTKIEDKLDDIKTKIDELNSNELLDVKSKIESRNRTIDEWKKKAGGICPKCLQVVDVQHVQKHVDEMMDEISEFKSKESKLTTQINRLKSMAESTEKKLNSSKPNVSIKEAEMNNRAIEELEKSILKQKSTINQKHNEENPYKALMDEYEQQLIDAEKKLQEHKAKMAKSDVFIRHLDYIYRMYHDKNKLKSLILTDLIPYLNARFSYYLEAVGLQAKLEFNQYLQCKSDRWDYAWFSGGEKKRIDVAFMFALYDLHSAIYGKQCNVLVLDEIDGRLDKDGIRSFVEIIWKDFVNGDQTTDRPDSLLIISHKSEMFDAFPTKIIVEKRPPGMNGKSTIRLEG